MVRQGEEGGGGLGFGLRGAAADVDEAVVRVKAVQGGLALFQPGGQVAVLVPLVGGGVVAACGQAGGFLGEAVGGVGTR